jgi:hypothetical protein
MAQKQYSDAIESLNTYLATFGSDENAWGELASIYLQLGDLKQVDS